MLEIHQVHVNLNRNTLAPTQTRFPQKSNPPFTQVRQYKKDFDLVRKALHK
jgi:hypothetical protein